MLLEKYKSKITCLSCKEKTVATFENEKSDDRVYYHCMDCGYRYSLDAAQRKFYKEKGKKKAGEDQPWQAGTLITLLMLVTILAIQIVDYREADAPLTDSSEQPQPSTWVIK